MNKWLKLSLQIVLLVVVLVLAWMLFRQIMTPIQFNKAVASRQAAVIERIIDIRSAEQAFKQKNQRYVGDFDSLINFVLTDSLEFERQTGSADDSVAVAKGLVKTEKFKRAVMDTVFAPRKLTVEQIRDLRFVPHAPEGTEYILNAGLLTTESKVVVPVFEAKAPFKMFLSDLDHQMLVNLIDETENAFNKYPGIQVGSIERATNDAGNWE
ncbi:MAG: hypothetical protein LBV18_02170 [Alistipes sp.]|jgi:hypothetical protein|nr:hypothetical protein [Alistipes sp.]